MRSGRTLLLADGTLYALVADGDGESFSEQFSLHGIDCDTGKTQFRVPNVGRLFAVAETRIYDNGIVLGGGWSPYGWDTFGINPDGSPVPRRWASTAPTPSTRIYSPALTQTVVDGTWYYCHGHDPVEVVAVDVDDGRRTWRRRFERRESPSIAAIDGRIVLAVERDDVAVEKDDESTIHVLDPDGGHTQQKRSVSGVQQVMGRDSTVYVETRQNATASTISAYDVEQLEQLWEAQVSTADWVRLGSAVGLDLALVAVGLAEGADDNTSDLIQVQAFDRHSGKQRWEQTVAFGSIYLSSSDVSVSIGDRTGYVATEGGDVFAVSMEDGAIRWQINIDGGGAISQPVIGDGRLYLFVQRKGIVALGEP
ncbi:outer membrane protein assembly factor BamB family protein [Halorhabdus salina]|uniref:outer membrane protein assembly factor BamB family protein n=1 Tax=Halorhabdus salina TaxID=2750670 RepID=UPI0015EF0B29|nr:PQQ-binding-like beta-propeller repeat protein [Halorhabdus salina]